jgi:hypothetical protein
MLRRGDRPVEWMGDVDLLGMAPADAQIADAVDHAPLGDLELRRSEVGDVALARSTEVEAHPHGPADDPPPRARCRCGASARRGAVAAGSEPPPAGAGLLAATAAPLSPAPPPTWRGGAGERRA